MPVQIQEFLIQNRNYSFHFIVKIAVNGFSYIYSTDIKSKVETHLTHFLLPVSNIK